MSGVKERRKRDTKDLAGTQEQSAYNDSKVNLEKNTNDLAGTQEQSA